MSYICQSQRAVVAFFVLLSLAIGASAVCVAFGDGNMAWWVPPSTRAVHAGTEGNALPEPAREAAAAAANRGAGT